MLRSNLHAVAARTILVHSALLMAHWHSSSGWHQHSGFSQGGGWGESQDGSWQPQLQAGSCQGGRVEDGSSQGGSWHHASCKAADDVGRGWQQKLVGNTPVLNLNSGQFEFVVALIFEFVGDPKEPKGSHMGQPKLYFWVPSFCPITSSVIGQKDVDPKPPPPQRTP